MSQEQMRAAAAARYQECLAVRDAQRRQLAAAEAALTEATDVLVAMLYPEVVL